MSAIEILESPFARIEIDRRARIVRLIRSELPLEVHELERAVEALELAIPLRARARLAMLLDARRAPLIRSDDLEQGLVRLIPRLHAGFTVRAVVISSAVGMLQAKRFASATGGREARLFHDDAEAMRYLQAELQKISART